MNDVNKNKQLLNLAGCLFFRHECLQYSHIVQAHYIVWKVIPTTTRTPPPSFARSVRESIFAPGGGNLYPKSIQIPRRKTPDLKQNNGTTQGDPEMF